jgi:hypothetical protein
MKIKRYVKIVKKMEMPVRESLVQIFYKFDFRQTFFGNSVQQGMALTSSEL